ncbi:MAG: penicillin-binding protein activator [Alphaproteobacteria bacterium]|nr:penicillin-binding protein activator [Alphaproteobacteria bacterium]
MNKRLKAIAILGVSLLLLAVAKPVYATEQATEGQVSPVTTPLTTLTPIYNPAPAHKVTGPFSIVPLQYEASLVVPNPLFDRRVKIAMLLPLSGPKAPIGQALLDAATLALFDMNRQDISIFPYDTKDSDEEAKSALEKAKNDGVHMIIGPVFSSATKAITPAARTLDIPVLSFTNDVAAAQAGIYALGADPRQQIERITDYAIDQGYTNFYVLAPGDAYGNAVANEVQKVTSLRNAKVAHTELFSGKPELLDAALKRFVTLLDKTQKSAIVIPVGGDSLTKIAAYLDANLKDRQNIKILGSSQWESSKIQSQSLLQGAWYPASDPDQIKRFYGRFKEVFNSEPPRLASMAYDALPLAFTAAKRADGKVVLTNSQGFIGIDGIIRLGMDGTTQRGFAIVEVTESGGRVIDRSPVNF